MTLGETLDYPFHEMGTIIVMAASHLESTRKNRPWALPEGHSL